MNISTVKRFFHLSFPILFPSPSVREGKELRACLSFPPFAFFFPLSFSTFFFPPHLKTDRFVRRRVDKRGERRHQSPPPSYLNTPPPKRFFSLSGIFFLSLSIRRKKSLEKRVRCKALSQRSSTPSFSPPPFPVPLFPPASSLEERCFDFESTEEVKGRRRSFGPLPPPPLLTGPFPLT